MGCRGVLTRSRLPPTSPPGRESGWCLTRLGPALSPITVRQRIKCSSTACSRTRVSSSWKITALVGGPSRPSLRCSLQPEESRFAGGREHPFPKTVLIHFDLRGAAPSCEVIRFFDNDPPLRGPLDQQTQFAAGSFSEATNLGR